MLKIHICSYPNVIVHNYNYFLFNKSLELIHIISKIDPAAFKGFCGSDSQGRVWLNLSAFVSSLAIRYYTIQWNIMAPFKMVEQMLLW